MQAAAQLMEKSVRTKAPHGPTLTVKPRQIYQQTQPEYVVKDTEITSAEGLDQVIEPQLTEKSLKESPFIDLNHPLDSYEAFKLALMLPVVVFKILWLAISLVYSWCILRLLLVGYDYKSQQPMHPLRRSVVAFWVKTWAAYLLFISGFYYVPVTGWKNLKEAMTHRAIIVFNHYSYVDAAVMPACFAPSGVAKSGVADQPFFGTFAIALQFLFVERKGSSDKANAFTLQQDPQTAVAARAADPNYPLVMLAPEATTKSQPCLLKFRKGAFVSGRPVLPVLLKYRYKHFNPGWGMDNTPIHCWRLLSQFINFLSIEILPVYFPNEEERGNHEVYAGHVRELMGKGLGVTLGGNHGIAEERELANAGVRLNWKGTEVLWKKGKDSLLRKEE